MRIAFDYTYGVGAASGIGRYANRLARAFSETASSDDSFDLFFIDFLRSFRKEKSCPECAADAGFSFSPAHILPARLYERLWNIPVIRNAAGIIPRNADLCHITSHAAIPVPSGMKMVCTVHDMAAWRFPCNPTMEKDRKAIRANVLQADAVITDSRFSADDLHRYLPESDGKVHVVHLGIDGDVFRPASSDSISRRRKALGLERPYMLSVGLVHPTKNHAFLGKVLESLGDIDLELVISGAQSYSFEKVRSEMASLRCIDRIRFLGRVDDAWLPALYTGAELYATASLSEGFGFTPLEAMSCGTPVVSSAAGSLPEILGTAATIIADNSIERWRDEVLRLLHDSQYRVERSSFGLSWAPRFTWRETAVKTLGVYRHVFTMQKH